MPTVLRTPPSEGEEGFTLAEMLVSLLVIALAATAFIGLIVSSVGSTRTLDDKVAANQLAQDRLEAAMSMPWNTVGLYSADSPPATANGGQATVTLAGTRPAGAPVPTESVTVRGVAYTVRTDVTWQDDASDLIGSSDKDGNLNDVKHVVVGVTWSSGGRSGSISLDGTRAATATEVPAGGGAAVAVTVGAPASQLLSSTNYLASAMTLTATTSRAATSVSLAFRTRAGVQTVTMTGSGTSWTYSLPTTTGPFDTGSTTFTATATTSAGTAAGSAVSQLVGGTNAAATFVTTASPSQTLSATGSLTNAITVTVTGSAPITGGTISYSPHTGSRSASLTGSGTSWSATVPADSTVFDPGTLTITVSPTFSGSSPTATTTVTLVSAALPPDVTNLTVVDQFGADTYQSFCVDSQNNQNQPLYRDTTVLVKVANTVNGDAVRLTVPGTSLDYTMLFVSTDTATGVSTWKHVVTAGTLFYNNTSVVLKAYATKTISGTSYRDDLVTSPGIPVQATSKVGSCT